MTSPPPGDSLQASILRACTTLIQLRSDWGGAFILSLGLSPAGTALPIASNIAGAVSLSIDHDPDHLRAVVRSGAVDFVVNSLDEAVRAMKNEVRKHAPLSVALSAPPLHTLEEILARGLAPQLFSSFLPPDAKILTAAEHLHSLGAELVDFSDDPAHAPRPWFRQSAAILEPLLTSRSWAMRTLSFDSPAQLRHFDHLALASLPPDDLLRRRWIEAAARILQRQRPPHRCLWLSPKEEQDLSAELSRGIPS
jgi:urocanate hydratase